MDAYVNLKNRQALEELREHRQRMRKRLAGRGGGLFDVSKVVRAYEDEIEIIEAGLNKL
ncbi:MAG: hypothetical protein LV473_23125 [Nitrospira sp.]|nr:hypothetical protein [Nitrospira sp.]